jgi:tetratricopeptide (TPR) repeat protein
MSEPADVSHVNPQTRTWPILSGTVPLLAAGFTRRPETGHGPWEALHPGVTVVIGPDADPRTSARHRGGTGKTQLASAFARRLWAAGDLDLLVWLDASSRDRIVAGYARALADIRVAAPPGQPEAAADRFLAWLGDTGRRWLVVLDGLADQADAEGLWPHGQSGQTVVTTRLARLAAQPAENGMRRAVAPAPQQVSVALPVFSQREARQYLSDRLDNDPYQAAGALDLAAAVECLPVGLDLAVAYLLDTGQDCRQYRLAIDQYRRDWVNGTGGDPLVPSWMLAFDRARQFAPTELPLPAIKLAAVLGSSWIPGAVLTSAAACTYATGRQDVTEADQAGIRAAFGNLERVGLVAIEPDDEVRTVRMAAAVQSSVQRVMGQAELRRAVQAGAEAVYECWPDGASSAELEQALRACAISLMRCDDQALWNPGCHPLLLRVGQSLDEELLAETSVGYWRDLADSSAKQHGARSGVTFQLRDRYASAATAAGQTDEAVVIRQELAADIDEAAGPASPQAIAARSRLAAAFRAAGRFSEAISVGTRAAADSETAFGSAHAQTKQSLRELGGAYSDAGQYREAVDVLQRCLTLQAQTAGMMHPETAAVRHELAEAYRRAGRVTEAIRIYQDALAQVENALGTGHPDTLAAREALAVAYYRAGRTTEAATAFERALAEWRRSPGHGPASTITARTNLASAYCMTGRPRQAIPLYEGVLADLERIRGAAHPQTLRTRWNLAAAFHKARRLPEAVELGETTLADCERFLGLGSRDTLTARANLAHAYHATGRLKRASAHFDRALRDCERALGPDDSLTSSVKDLRNRYLAGRQGFAPIIAPPEELSGQPRTTEAAAVVVAAASRVRG